MPTDERPPATGHLKLTTAPDKSQVEELVEELVKTGGSPVDSDQLQRLMAEGAMTVLGRMPWSSNATFLAICADSDQPEVKIGVIYKPAVGERPLWDFPGGLHRREVAAWVLSDALGWDLIPLTLSRDDAPLGEGSLQHFVAPTTTDHYFTIIDQVDHHAALRRMCVFDVIANNTDRKSGHCLLDIQGNIWAIDNALCFHPHPKLRTVIWEFAGDAIDEQTTADLGRLLAQVPEELEALLTSQEIEALMGRTASLLASGTLPLPDPASHQYPWPLV